MARTYETPAGDKGEEKFQYLLPKLQQCFFPLFLIFVSYPPDHQVHVHNNNRNKINNPQQIQNISYIID